MMKKLFIVVNVDWFFLSHRKDVAIAAKQSGYEVTIVTADTGKLNKIAGLGFSVINLPMSRSGMNVLQEFKSFLFLLRLYRKERPDIIHHVGMKVILWGTLAAKFSRVHGVVNAISGLGGFFAEENHSIAARLMPTVLRFSHRQRNLLCIFQNNEDKSVYIKNGIIKDNQARLIKGSGVDLNVFSYCPEPETGKIRILLTARMIQEKGVFVLTDAARILKDEYFGKVAFLLVGGLDDHPGAITKNQLLDACEDDYIQWLGYRSDVKELLQSCHIVAFPSYYMEGLPKSLIEACAVGRPIITTDSVGCREAVIDGYNGYLVPKKDPNSLAEKLIILIEEKSLRLKMGINSRKFAEENFSISSVIDKHLSIYEELSV